MSIYVHMQRYNIENYVSLGVLPACQNYLNYYLHSTYWNSTLRLFIFMYSSFFPLEIKYLNTDRLQCCICIAFNDTFAE